MDRNIVFVMIMLLVCHLGKSLTAGCELGGKVYKEGERFEDGCNRCACLGNVVRCTRNICAPGEHGIKGVCTVNGKKYNVGDTFKMKCNDCSCGKTGNISCTWKICPPIHTDGN